MKRRILISLSTALVLAGLCTVAHADGDWPKQGIRLVVPFTAGSGTDIIARAVGERLGQALGQSVTIDNRPGAGGTVAANQVAKAAPDGYTLLVHSSGHVVNPSLYPNLPYDTLKDLAGITTLASLPNVMVVSPAKGYKDVKDLVAKVKQKPEGFYYASAGNGSATHINGEKFRLAAGISPTHVPYRGTPEALTDTMAVGTPMRSDDLPNVPTTAEAGFAGSEYTFWVGMLAPAATPKSVIDRLNQEVLKILNNKEFKNRLDVIGATSMPMAPAAFDHFIKVETEATSKLVNAAGIKAN